MPSTPISLPSIITKLIDARKKDEQARSAYKDALVKATESIDSEEELNCMEDSIANVG